MMPKRWIDAAGHDRRGGTGRYGFPMSLQDAETKSAVMKQMNTVNAKAKELVSQVWRREGAK